MDSLIKELTEAVEKYNKDFSQQCLEIKKVLEHLHEQKKVLATENDELKNRLSSIVEKISQNQGNIGDLVQELQKIKVEVGMKESLLEQLTRQAQDLAEQRVRLSTEKANLKEKLKEISKKL